MTFPWLDQQNCMIELQFYFILAGLGREGVGALLPGGLRGHRGQHAHDSGHPHPPPSPLLTLRNRKDWQLFTATVHWRFLTVHRPSFAELFNP